MKRTTHRPVHSKSDETIPACLPSPYERTATLSLSHLHRHPQPAEDDVRLEDLVLEGSPTPPGLAPLGRLLQLPPDPAHGPHRRTFELGNLASPQYRRIQAEKNKRGGRQRDGTEGERQDVLQGVGAERGAS